MPKLLEIIDSEEGKQIVTSTRSDGHYTTEPLWDFLCHITVVMVKGNYLTLGEALGLPMDYKWFDETRKWSRTTWSQLILWASNQSDLNKISAVLLYTLGWRFRLQFWLANLKWRIKTCLNSVV